jgi:hypothetical protein
MIFHAAWWKPPLISLYGASCMWLPQNVVSDFPPFGWISISITLTRLEQ